MATQVIPTSIKNQQIDYYPQIIRKRALEPPEEFLPHSGTKNLRITTQEDKSDNFLQPASSHSPSWHRSMPRGTFSARKSPLARKGKVRPGTSFSSLLRYRTKLLFLVSPQTD